MSGQTEASAIPADATVVAGFEHVVGKHCGSTALGDVLRFYGLDLPEGVVFGLAAGACFYYVQLPGSSPTRMITGRVDHLEKSFVELSGGVLEELAEKDPEKSWQMASSFVDQGRPTILLTDLYYLDHYDNSAHFPRHAVVLAGYDSDSAFLADTNFEGLIPTPMASLAAARHAEIPPFPLSGEMIVVNDRDRVTQLKENLPEQIERSTARAVQKMLEPEYGDMQGIPGLGKLVDEVASWPNEAEDWQWCARFSYQVIERRGTGGGCFRRLYAEYLDYAAELGLGASYKTAAELCTQVADSWTELSTVFRAASKEDEPQEATWGEIARLAELVRDGEERLWNCLA